MAFRGQDRSEQGEVQRADERAVSPRSQARRSFWDDLEETLILSDLGAQATMGSSDRLRDQATRRALPDAYAVLDLLADEISGLFAEPDPALPHESRLRALRGH